MKFKGICLITKDVYQLKNFYQHILPVEIEEDSDDFAKFLINGFELSICSSKVMEIMAPDSIDNAGFGSYTMEIEVDDVDQEYEKLIAKQVPIVKPPTTQSWGIRSVWFRDPDGNIINFHVKI